MHELLGHGKGDQLWNDTIFEALLAANQTLIILVLWCFFFPSIQEVIPSSKYHLLNSGLKQCLWPVAHRVFAQATAAQQIVNEHTFSVTRERTLFGLGMMPSRSLFMTSDDPLQGHQWLRGLMVAKLNKGMVEIKMALPFRSG